MHTHIPGGVYLCQVDDAVSCGACCGLYNVADPSLENLQAILEYRTGLYAQTPRTYEALENFADHITSVENQDRPFPEFHHCPYIGLIGENRDRPGCLLHPLGKGNNNTDFRGLSHWGGFACASYFCPTCHEVPARYKDILKGCADHWYIYGLFVTENHCLSNYFNLVEQGLGAHLDVNQALGCQAFKTAFQGFLDLKINWPYRPESFNRLGNYFFKDDLYPRDTIDYQALGLDIPACDTILRTLGTQCTGKTDLTHAIDHIGQLIDQAVWALKRPAKTSGG